MSFSKVNHNVWHPVKDESVAKSSNTTTEWWDVGGWTDKKVWLEVDSSGSIDANVTLHVSPQGYYELNNKTCTTDDYESVTVVDGHTGATAVSFDSDDVADLGKPMRSIRFYVENDDATDASTMNVWIEGWS